MSADNTIMNLQGGTSRKNRLIKPLLPDYFYVEERSLEDWIIFAQKLSKHIQYYDLSNQKKGDWSAFLGDINPKEISAILRNLLAPGETFKVDQYLEPHQALFFTFLLLLRHPQRQLEDLTKKHLDYYYRGCLQLTEKPAIPDQVHVVFELAKGKDSCLIKKGTSLSAGKDSNGNDLVYTINDDLLITSAQIASIKTLSSNLAAITVFEQKEQETFIAKRFKTFGDSENTAQSLPNDPKTPFGFAISSPLLRLTAGERTIKLTLFFDQISDEQKICLPKNLQLS